jgi:propionyl-CoA synthetase
MLATSLLRRAPRLARLCPARLLSTQHPFRYSKPEYLSSHGASVNPETFEQYQLDLAKEHVHWFKEPTVAVDVRPDQRHDWFPDGTTNMSYNCLDRHLATRADQPALSYYSAVGGENRTYTYAELHDQVGRAAQSLLDMGVKTGDAVLCYLPMIPQSNVMMLACARIGAVHSVVFGGFAAKELAVRIKATKPSVIVSADFGRDGAKVLPYVPPSPITRTLPTSSAHFLLSFRSPRSHTGTCPR